jgi:hypothetical protein
MLSLICLFVVNSSFGLGCASLESLYKVALQTGKFSKLSKVEFGFALKTMHVKEVAILVKQLPKEERVGALLEVAVNKGLLKPTEVIQYQHKLVSVEKYDDVLLGYLKNGETNLSSRLAIDAKKLRNGNLAGKKHPVTGVAFDVNGFPIFKPVMEMQLPSRLYKATDKEQFEYATKQLCEGIKSDPKLAAKFSEKQLEQIKGGFTPSGYTWHHHQDIGRMQLVETKVHQATGHTGGKAIWGGGSECR